VSSNNRFIKFILLICLALNLYGNNIENKSIKNGLYTLMALDAQQHKFHIKSAMLYEVLLKDTPKYEYFTRTIGQYLLGKDYKDMQRVVKQYLNKFPKHKETVMQEYIYSLMMTKNYENALKISKELLKKYNSPYNYTIVGDIYYAMKSYSHAITYYESSYASKQNLDTLIPLVDILYSYLDKKPKAIAYLETYYRDNGCNEKVCYRLLRAYMESQNIDGTISILKTLHKKYKNEHNKIALIKISNLLAQYLEKKDIHKAIKFLEKNRYDNLKLLALYEKVQNSKKGLKLVRKIYRKTKNKELLGQIAIFEFNLAKNKHKIMKHVIANFELALKVKSNPAYENYYGYLLIEYNINIKKGLALVKKALKANPNNLAYKDSVAWGYYKVHNCKKALKLMNEIFDEIRHPNPDINKHYDKIKKCK
jgi:tetratricopeptide (TPR) repeat protein